MDFLNRVEFKKLMMLTRLLTERGIIFALSLKTNGTSKGKAWEKIGIRDVTVNKDFDTSWKNRNYGSSKTPLGRGELWLRISGVSQECQQSLLPEPTCSQAQQSLAIDCLWSSLTSSSLGVLERIAVDNIRNK
ncbi:hypothetical protein EK904_003992 [Melospiza melodia maxima]|nr:hypothetical protein EK904_003992 [Melospiza melodia maxima]